MSQFIQSSMDWYVKRSQRSNNGQLAAAKRQSEPEPLTGFGLHRAEQQVQQRQQQPLLQARQFNSRIAHRPQTELKRSLSNASRGPNSHTEHQPKLAAVASTTAPTSIATRSRSASSQPPPPPPSAFNSLITGSIAQLLRWRSEQPRLLSTAPLCETLGRVVRLSEAPQRANHTQVLLLRDAQLSGRGPILQATYHAIDFRLPADVKCPGALVRCVGRFQLGGRFQAYKLRRLPETSGAELVARLASLTQHQLSRDAEYNAKATG